MAKYRSYQLLLILSQVVAAQGPFSISTFAGGAQASGPVSALEVAWASVEGIAVDGAGNLYVADAPDNRVWRVLRSGRVELLAGTGESGFSGDGGAATAARLNTPYGVAVDGAGNVFVADLGNGRVRRIAASGTITTVAGGGTTEPSFFGAPLQGREAKLSSPRNLVFDGQGMLFFTDIGANRVLRLATDGTLVHVAGQKDPGDAFDNVPALLAPLRAPTALAFDRGGALYVADSGNKVIRRILRGTMTKVTSTGVAARVSFGTITGLAIDAGGELYVAEGRETPLKKISPSGTVAQYPNGGRDVAVDGNGVLLADGGVVRRYSAAGAEVVAGSGGYYFAGDGGPAASARMRMPTALALDRAGNLYIADTANHRVRRVTLEGKIDTVAGPNQLNSPAGLAVDEGGMLWIADTGNNAIKRLLPNGTLETWTTGLRRPRGLAFDRAGVLVAADSENHRIVRLPAANRVEVLVGTGRAGNGGDGSAAAQAQLNMPTDVEYDRAGVLYICDGGNKRVRRVVGGIMQGYPSAGLVEPVGIALGTEGLYVTDAGTHRVAWLAANGGRVEVAGRGVAGFAGEGTPAADALLNRPSGIVLTASGNLLFADQENHVVRRLMPGSGGTVIGESRVMTLVSSANLKDLVVVPGSLMTLFGSGLGPAVGATGRLSVTGRLESRVEGVEVRFDGVAAPLLWVQEGQINLQVPGTLVGRARTTVEVEYNGVIKTRFAADVEDTGPALFLLGDGTSQVLALNQDGSVNADGNAAARGEIVVLYATGTGAWDRAWADGFPGGDPYPKPSAAIRLDIGDRTAELRWFGMAPGMVGVVQLNAVVPVGGQGSGRIPVVLRAGSKASGASAASLMVK